MRNPLKLVQSLGTPTVQKRTQPVKSRRQRRQEERDRIKSSKSKQK